MLVRHDIRKGASAPLGATINAEGVNFSVYSREAERMEILLFDDVDAPVPSHIIELDPAANRSFHYWHVFVPGLKAGQVYAYRAHGPYAPERGVRFDGSKILLDPYGKLVGTPKAYDRGAACREGSTVPTGMRSIVVDMSTYDWEGDQPLARPFEDTIIYEMHVAGFTKHPSSGVSPDKRGTYAGLIERIPHLKRLGVTAVELLPVFAFDPDDAPLGRKNYWGYSPISFFAPHSAYSSKKDPLGAVDEFRDMVKALHTEGIEVILDVVYNHTAEGDCRGPTFCFRGFGSGSYYLLEGDRYSNYSGTGNTINANHPVTRRLIQDSLRYWVSEFHIDGFRFDLASILSRDADGRPLSNPHTLFSIETDPVLVDTKLIAEPWDAGGLYQVGTFIGDRWKEWNGKYRDDVRAFVCGHEKVVRSVPNRLLASPDLYERDNLDPEQSVNFITCHDGYTLEDLVSYNDKHNDANGEGNRDGHNGEVSWNHGVEGPTDDSEIDALRLRQIKNFMTFNLVSVGVPMLLMGDECRRTQMGNNNAYGQDNEISWFDWSLVEKNAGLVRFVELLTFWRQRWRASREEATTLAQLLHRARIEWHGVELHKPDWSDNSHTMSVSIGGGRAQFIFNSYWEPLTFELAPCVKGKWCLLLDTARPSPEDIHDYHHAPTLESQTLIRLQPRSAVVVISEKPLRI